MSDGSFLFVIIAVALATLICRGAFIVPSNAHHLSKRLESFLEFIPVSATAAIAMSSLVYNGSSDSYIFSPERLIAGIAAFGVAYVSKSVVATIVLGMSILWVLQAYKL